MKLMIFTVRDKKAESSNTPFFQKSAVQALRAFKAEINRPHEQNMMYLYPDEWDLYCIGAFDEDTGLLEPMPQQLIANGKAVKEQEAHG